LSAASKVLRGELPFQNQFSRDLFVLDVKGKSARWALWLQLGLRWC